MAVPGVGERRNGVSAAKSMLEQKGLKVTSLSFLSVLD